MEGRKTRAGALSIDRGKKRRGVRFARGETTSNPKEGRTINKGGSDLEGKKGG